MSDTKENEIHKTIQDLLVKINNITSNVKTELFLIHNLVKEDEQLSEIVKKANEKLSGKVQQMGLNVAEIISENTNADRLNPSLVNPITSVAITEQFFNLKEELSKIDT